MERRRRHEHPPEPYGRDAITAPGIGDPPGDRAWITVSFFNTD
jgi:hypothetical protein